MHAKSAYLPACGPHRRLDGNKLNATLPAGWGCNAAPPPPPLRSPTANATAAAPPGLAGRACAAGLSSLSELSADDNRLTGQLPAGWSALRQLGELSLRGNLLAGPLPPAWAPPLGLLGLRYAAHSGPPRRTRACGRELGRCRAFRRAPRPPAPQVPGAGW